MDGVGGSSSGPCRFLQRESTKRNFDPTAARGTSPDDSLFMPADDHYDNEHTAQRRRLNRLALPPRRPHVLGDGYDLRRPVMSSGGASDGDNNNGNRGTTVIDLTNEDGAHNTGNQASVPVPTTAMESSSRAQRPPRFGRNIIDIDSEGEGEEEDHEHRPAAPPTMPDLFPPRSSRHPHHPRFSILSRPMRHHNMEDDVVLVEERPRSRPPTISRTHTPSVAAQRSVTPYPTGLNDAIDLTGDIDDDVVHVDTRARQGVNVARPSTTAGVGTRSFADHHPWVNNILENHVIGNRLLARLNVNAAGQGPQDLINYHQARNNALDEQRHRDHIQPRLRFGQAPTRPGAVGAIGGVGFGRVMMDYDIPGFDLGMVGANRPPTPKYEPPAPAAPGFTRSPKENEVVVCPNCGDELAMGDNELKQKVYVVKKCGHAYCGDCSENRAKNAAKGKKGKGKAPAGPTPFSKCVVDGCSATASFKSMVHVFLGS